MHIEFVGAAQTVTGSKHLVHSKAATLLLDCGFFQGRRREPCVIISASGMCEAGRVVHHLKAAVENARNTVCIVGFQAPHTLGRRLVERRPRVKIFGVERDLRAEVVTLNGLSAHADQRDLVDYAVDVRARGRLGRVALVHGEPPAQAVLRDKLRAQDIEEVFIPSPGATVDV